MSGTVDYDVFGEPVTETGVFAGSAGGSGGISALVFAYAGKPYDPVTGLSDYGFRDYASGLARFTTVDPIRDGSNWYAYCNSDPVNYVDAWGLTASDKGENDESNTLGRILGYIGSFTKDILGIAAIGMGKALEWSAPFLGGLAAVGANYGTGGAALAYSSSIAVGVTVATKSFGAALTEQGQALLAQGDSSTTLHKSDNSQSAKDSTPIDGNDNANKFAQEKGYDDAHAFKKQVLKDAKAKDQNVAHYDIYNNAKTGQTFLKHKSTGIYIPE